MLEGTPKVIKSSLSEKMDLAIKQELQDPVRERLEVHVLPQSNSKKSACRIKHKSVKPKQVPEMVRKLSQLADSHKGFT